MRGNPKERGMPRLKIDIPVKRIPFKRWEFVEWKYGERDNCTDDYLKNLEGTNGFGEFIAGRYFEKKGYAYLHRYSVFGANRIGTFAEADEVLKDILGQELFHSSQTLYNSFPDLKMELPDLMVYDLARKELLFVEVKLLDTNDKIRPPQVNGLALVNLLLGAEVYIVEVYEDLSV